MSDCSSFNEIVTNRMDKRVTVKAVTGQVISVMT